MAIHDEDKLSGILLSNIHDKRSECLAWLFAAQLNGKLAEFNPGWPGHRNAIASTLETDKNSILAIQQALAERMIPEQNLQWLDNSVRQSTWIRYHIKDCFVRSSAGFLQNNGPRDYFDTVLVPTHLQGNDCSIALIDYYSHQTSTSLKEAISNLEQLNQKWIFNTAGDKYFAWINKESAEERVAYFWSWTLGKIPQRSFQWKPPEDYEQLLCALDSFNLGIQDKELYGTKARKSWAQQEKRISSKDKKQCNLWLTTKNIERLKQLSEAHKLTRTELIELLIESESRNPFHINVRLQRRKNLIDPTE